MTATLELNNGIAMQYTHPNGVIVPVTYYNAAPKKFQVFYSYNGGQTWVEEASCNDPVEWYETCRRNSDKDAYANAMVMFSPITARRVAA